MRIAGLIQIIGFILATLLTLYFIIGQPLLGARRYRRFREKVTTGSLKRGQYYLASIGREWLWFALVGITIALTSAPLADFGLAPPDNWEGTLILIAVGLVSFAAALWIVLARLKKRGTARLATGIAPIRDILPKTGAERWLWVALSVSAGICEEVVFRGFLTWYFLQVGALLGWQVASSWPAFIVALTLSTLIFGLDHAYQGKRGILLTTLIGAAFAYCYALTASLLLPVILHILIDVRNVFVAPLILKGEKKQEEEATTAS